MNKLNMAIAACAVVLTLTGCSVTNVNKNSLKEPNGNIRVNDLAIKSVVPVSYSYTTVERECSDVEFLKNVTGQKKNGVKIDNVYEIHWNNVETHQKIVGISTPKQYSCNFWGIGIEYIVPSPAEVPSKKNNSNNFDDAD